MNYYKIHHLVVASTLHFPELAPTTPQTADLLITEGAVPVHLANEEISKTGELWQGRCSYELSSSTILMKFTDIGRVLINGDHTITLDKDTSVDYDKIRLYLLGTCLGFYLLKQAIFPFHASTIHTQYGTAMFIGPSGRGKSTIAAKFVKEGYTLLTDDVCVVRFLETTSPYAYPSIHRIKLWDDSVSALGYTDSCSTVIPDWDKKQIYAQSKLSQIPRPLTVIYQLWPEDDTVLKIKPLTNQDKLMALISNTFRGEGIEILGLQKEHFMFCSRIAQSVPVKRLHRPKAQLAIDELYELVLNDLKNINSLN